MNNWEIDKGFIDYVRLNLNITNWVFDQSEEKEIVPNELTHGYLIDNFDIDTDLYKFYLLPMQRLLSDNEFQDLVDTGYCGKKETTLRPYTNIIYGAYYNSSDLNCKLNALLYRSGKYTSEGKKIKYFNDLIPYFKEYARGFENGFNEFDSSQIKPYLTMLADKQDYVTKVFEFTTKQVSFTHSWANLASGFKGKVQNSFKRNQIIEIVDAFEDGQKQGYFYKAWSVIFSNNSVFAPLFQQYFKSLPPEQMERKDKQASTFIPQPFSGIFIDSSLVNDCLTLLKSTDKPCVSDENDFLNNKGVFIIWLNVLEYKKLLKITFKNDIERSETLNFNFKGLDISASLFRHNNQRAKERYKSHFEAEISAIKHKQS